MRMTSGGGPWPPLLFLLVASVVHQGAEELEVGVLEIKGCGVLVDCRRAAAAAREPGVPARC